MTTTYTTRTPVSSTWSNLRLGGAYLTNTLGEYITTSLGERIIVIIPGGELQMSTWNVRTPI